MSPKVSISCLKCSLLGLFLLLLQPVFSQYTWGDIDQELQAKQKLLGNEFVMMLWNKDSMLYKKEMGMFNSKTQVPIASCSKWLTAALVMIFVDEGKISLDDKIGQWLPEFDRYGKSYITLRYCLAHMTGIKDEKPSLKKFAEQRRYSSLEDEVNSFAAREIRANPSQDFWYGNIGLNIAGRVIEIVSKKRFDVIIKQKLFTPLEMRRTTFTNMYGGAINPSGGAQSIADDYMKFLVMLLNKGKYKEKQVISEESINTMMQIQTKPELIKYAPEAAQGFNYAFGSWVVEEKSPLPTSPEGGRVAGALASPGLFGTWPMIDFCRGYAYLVFVKNLLGEERATEHLELKKLVDEQIPSTCK